MPATDQQTRLGVQADHAVVVHEIEVPGRVRREIRGHPGGEVGGLGGNIIGDGHAGNSKKSFKTARRLSKSQAYPETQGTTWAQPLVEDPSED